jgi:hypothetical protein
MFRAARLISDLAVSERNMVLATERSPKERFNGVHRGTYPINFPAKT